MNKAVLTVIAISTLFLGFAGNNLAYADDEAQESKNHILLYPEESHRFTDYNGNKFIARCLNPQPSKLNPVCKIVWWIDNTHLHFAAFIGKEKIGDTAMSLEELKNNPALANAISSKACQTDASYDAPEKAGREP